jgi:hypothetical protein
MGMNTTPRSPPPRAVQPVFSVGFAERDGEFRAAAGKPAYSGIKDRARCDSDRTPAAYFLAMRGNGAAMPEDRRFFGLIFRLCALKMISKPL